MNSGKYVSLDKVVEYIQKWKNREDDYINSRHLVRHINALPVLDLDAKVKKIDEEIVKNMKTKIEGLDLIYKWGNDFTIGMEKAKSIILED
jgi:hypothetical protein